MDLMYYREAAIVVLLLLLALSHGSACYWKGKAEDGGYDDEYEWHRDRINEWNAWARELANQAHERSTTYTLTDDQFDELLTDVRGDATERTAARVAMHERDP